MSPRFLKPRRILVIANETVTSETLRAAIAEGAAGADLLVVAPALNTRARYWTSDDRRARAAAERRLQRSLDALAKAGYPVTGYVGDANPLVAIEDALRLFPAQGVIIATHPPGRSHWLARNVVPAARERFDLPIAHVVVPTARAPALAAA